MDYIICELCGTSFHTNSSVEICPSCLSSHAPKQAKQAKPRAKASSATQEARNVAKMFGGKALKGTAKQKDWAEQIRADFLKRISEEDATSIVTGGSFLDTAEFWIDNRGKTFTWADLIESVNALNAVYDKTYDVLARTNPTPLKDAARAEIVKTIKASAVVIRSSFPNFDPYSEI